jgi:integrase/recombinase XerD
MKIQRVNLGQDLYTWLVLDDNYLPIKPITSFIEYLNNTEKSPNTVRSYTNHLKLFWDFLSINNNKDWKTLKLGDFARFVAWLRQQPKRLRLASTVNAILASVSSFYRYHNQIGTTSITLIEPANYSSNRYRALLYHVFKSYPTQRRVVSLKQPKDFLKVLTPEQVTSLIGFCKNLRDRFLIMLLYETGLRIGQALALRHDDIKSWDNEIHVIYRFNNANGVRNKSMRPNIVHVSPELMHMYSEYLGAKTEDLENLSEYVFTDLQSEKPQSYTSVRLLFTRLSKKLGIKVTPHMLRHTHATELIRSGWDSTLVQKRLGHSNVLTTLNIYSHVNQDDLKRAFKRYIDKNGDKKC